jgi:putative transposase
MARIPRIQYEGALYHVINRGNYRRDIFESSGAAIAFEGVLSETCARHGWRVHAYAIMRNHFHLALETPQPNLVEGMHWLQGTFATRFNRFREEQGHLFQGRYKALLIEDAAALLRVIHYIHLNPVRAQLVPPAHCATFRWGSLCKFRLPSRPAWLAADVLLPRMGFSDSTAGWKQYTDFLAELAVNGSEQERLGFGNLSSGWAIGTGAWRKALAEDNRALALSPGLETREIRLLKEAHWRTVLEGLMIDAGKSSLARASEATNADWKISIASELRAQGVPYGWIRAELQMSAEHKIRAQVYHFRHTRKP